MGGFKKRLPLAAFWILTVLSRAQATSPHFVYQEDWRERTCDQVLASVRHKHVDIPLPPDITGEWVSHRCEIRSGPEYVIRHLRISHDSKFESIVYLYEDPNCHRPLYAIHSKGSQTVKKASWTVRGGTEAEYEIYSSHLIPYSHNATLAISTALAKTECNIQTSSKDILLYKKYLIYSWDPSQPKPAAIPDTVTKTEELKDEGKESVKDRGAACFQALNFSLNELQLVMVELKHRRTHHHHHHKKPHHGGQHHHGHSGHHHHHHHPHHPYHHHSNNITSRDQSHNDHTEVIASKTNKLLHESRTFRHEDTTNERIPHKLIEPTYSDGDQRQVSEPNASGVNGQSLKKPATTDSNGRGLSDRPNLDVTQMSSEEGTWPYAELESRELLLGAVHSKPQEKLSHRPSSYQTALKDARTPGCGVCSRVASASPMYPPRLPVRTGTLLSLEGEWVSTRCESRQYGMFLTRRLQFLDDGHSWRGQYDYYHDALCKHPSFSLDAKGSYSGGTDSKLIPGAKDYSFKVTRLKVTPHDARTAESMNHYGGDGCGKAHAWAAGHVQDVTWTGGCVTLGIRLPNMERDIMRMEILNRKLHLYVGQRLLDRKPGTAYQMERPTAFQEPLVKCDQQGLDMSINTAPGGHGWAGAIALPLSSGPDDDVSQAGTNTGRNSGNSLHNTVGAQSRHYVVMSSLLLSLLFITLSFSFSGSG